MLKKYHGKLWNEIPQTSSIIGASPPDCLVSYPKHLLGKSYPSTEKQSVYSTAQADWVSRMQIIKTGKRETKEEI